MVGDGAAPRKAESRLGDDRLLRISQGGPRLGRSSVLRRSAKTGRLAISYLCSPFFCCLPVWGELTMKAMAVVQHLLNFMH